MLQPPHSTTLLNELAPNSSHNPSLPSKTRQNEADLWCYASMVMVRLQSLPAMRNPHLEATQACRLRKIEGHEREQEEETVDGEEENANTCWMNIAS